MYKKVSMSSKQMISMFMALGFSACALAMETNVGSSSTVVGGDSVRESKISFVCSDNATVTVPKSTAVLSGTIKNVLEECGESSESISLKEIDSSTLKTIFGMAVTITDIPLRKNDNKQSPYKVHEVVDVQLRGHNAEQIEKALVAAVYLEVPSLIDGIIHSFVFAADCRAMPDILKNIKCIELYNRYLAAKAFGISKEFDIFDAIEDSGKNIYYDSGALDLNKTKITSLCGLEYLVKVILAGKPINRIGLDYNYLVTIPDNSFSCCSDLQELSLSANYLTSVAPNAFNALERLKELYLDRNELTTIPASAIRDLYVLERLDLHANNLANLPSGVFKRLGNLAWVDVSENQLTGISEDVLRGMNLSLKTFNFLKNKITKEEVDKIKQYLGFKEK